MNDDEYAQAAREWAASARRLAETLAARQGGTAERIDDTTYLVRDRGQFVIGLWVNGIGYDCTPTRA